MDNNGGQRVNRISVAETGAVPVSSTKHIWFIPSSHEYKV